LSTFPAAYNELIEAFDVPVVLSAADGVVQSANSLFSEWDRRCGGDGEVPIGKSVSELGGTMEEGEALRKLVADACTAAEAAPLLVRSGEAGVGEIRARVIRDASGETLGALLLWRDGDEVAQLRSALQHAVRLEAIGQVAGNVAHEINNALSLVTGYAELGLGDEQSENAQRNLRTILDGGRRAGRVAEHLRFFARRLRGGREQIDPNDLVGDVAAVLRRSFERQGVMLLEDLHPQRLEIEVHVGQIQLVVLSLVQNGLEAMVRAELEGIVQVRTAIRDDRLVLEVEDDGPGLSPEELEHAFDNSFTRKGREGGTGLGLGLCRDIIRSHGGELSLAGDEEGTCATVELPLGERE
jgi:signal transduction histidine kinase